jgi:ketosteroid isomerase-like protein
MKKFVVIVFLLSTIVPHILAAQTKLERVREQVKILKKERQNASLEQDYEKAITYFTDDVLIMPGMQPPFEGKAELRKMFKQDEKNGVKIHAVSDNIQKDWLCGDDYYERGTWSMSITSNDTQRPIAFLGSYFQIWQKQKDGSYKIKFNIWNLNHQP